LADVRGGELAADAVERSLLVALAVDRVTQAAFLFGEDRFAALDDGSLVLREGRMGQRRDHRDRTQRSEHLSHDQPPDAGVSPSADVSIARRDEAFSRLLA